MTLFQVCCVPGSRLMEVIPKPAPEQGAVVNEIRRMFGVGVTTSEPGSEVTVDAS